MKRRELLTIMISVCFIFPGIIAAQNITITQIDSADLMLNSSIDCYLSISNDQGEPIEDIDPALIKIKHETSSGMTETPILDIQRNNFTNGKINFLLVLDNSGSMYEPVGDGTSGNRMDHAVRAVKEFLSGLDNPNARVGLSVFNTKYKLLSEPVREIGIIEEALGNISKPMSEDAYTELYYSIKQAAMDMSRYKGRKAIILLSDGENYPYFTRSGNIHPDLGERVYLPEEGLESLKRESVTLYSINFSSEKDKSLSSITVNSGGTMYDALTDKDLSGIYNRIRDRIEKEYKVTVRAPIVFMETPEISAEYAGFYDKLSYYSSSLMGLPGDKSLLLFLLIFLVTLIVWFLLAKMRLEKPANRAELSMLPLGTGKPLQRTIALTEQRTVIGSSPGAGFTVAGVPSLKESHATIVQDKKAGTFTLISDEEVRVNNRMTKKRKLNPGDVINVEGATIVFDAPEQ